MPRKSKKSEGPERAFDVTLLPEKYTLADLERMAGISQADSGVPDAGPNNSILPKPGEDCRTLPPLPPENANLSIPDLAAELRPVMALFPQAQAVIEYGMKHPLSGEQRRRLTIAFDNERAAVQRILEELVGGLQDIPVHDRTEWHRQFMDVCSRLVELVNACLSDRKTDMDRLDCLYREYLDVLGQIGFFLNVQANEMEREHARFVRDFAKQRRAHDAAKTGAGTLVVQADMAQTSPPQITEGAFTILCALADSPTRLMQADLQQCTKPNMDRKTVSKHLQALVREGLIEYNPRNKQGAIITQKGRQFLDRKS